MSTFRAFFELCAFELRDERERDLFHMHTIEQNDALLGPVQ